MSVLSSLHSLKVTRIPLISLLSPCFLQAHSPILLNFCFLLSLLHIRYPHLLYHPLLSLESHVSYHPPVMFTVPTFPWFPQFSSYLPLLLTVPVFPTIPSFPSFPSPLYCAHVFYHFVISAFLLQGVYHH